MEKQNEKKTLPGQRCDGYVGQPTPCGNPIREKWIHKDVVKHLSDNEDDFIIEQKPKLIEKANIQKEIEEQAKAAPKIKELVKQVMETGDESILVNCSGSYGDVTDMPTDLHQAISIVKEAKAKGMNLEDDSILKMSKDDITKYINDVVAKMVEGSKPKEESVKQQEDNSGGAE